MGRLSDYIIDFELNDPEIVAEEQERNKVTSWVCNKDQKKKLSLEFWRWYYSYSSGLNGGEQIKKKWIHEIKKG